MKKGENGYAIVDLRIGNLCINVELFFEELGKVLRTEFNENTNIGKVIVSITIKNGMRTVVVTWEESETGELHVAEYISTSDSIFGGGKEQTCQASLFGHELTYFERCSVLF